MDGLDQIKTFLNRSSNIGVKKQQQKLLMMSIIDSNEFCDFSRVKYIYSCRLRLGVQVSANVDSELLSEVTVVVLPFVIFLFPEKSQDDIYLDHSWNLEVGFFHSNT